MKIFITALWIMAAAGLQAQTMISQFKFDSNPVTTANVGPNAISVSAAAGSSAGGASNNGLNPKAQGEKADVNLTIPGSPSFDVAGIDVSVAYRRNEADAYFFTRGSSLNFGMSGGSLFVTYKVENGANSFTTVTSGSVYTIPSDDIYRTYRFIYNPSNGKGTLLVNGNAVWSSTGTSNKNLYWTGAGNVVVGQLMDGNGSSKTVLDNFTVYSVTATVLPIELLSFHATPNKDNTVSLNWSTASERNNDYFTVERSANGIDWEEIIQVTGAGNSTIRQDYEAMDSDPAAGIQYYRLRQTDYDGRNETFEVVSVEVAALEMRVEMYPNPTSGAFTLIADGLEGAQNSKIRILNTLGGVVVEKDNVAEDKNVLDISGFNGGTYVVEVIVDGVASRSVLVKN